MRSWYLSIRSLWTSRRSKVRDEVLRFVKFRVAGPVGAQPPAPLLAGQAVGPVCEDLDAAAACHLTNILHVAAPAGIMDRSDRFDAGRV